MALAIRFNNLSEFIKKSKKYQLPLSTIEEVETSLKHTIDRNMQAELETISFPQIKSVLWDRTGQAPPVTIHITHYRNLIIEVSSQVIRLAYRHLTNTSNKPFSCCLIGSLASNHDGYGMKLVLDRFDTRHQSTACHAPGDLIVPFQVCAGKEGKQETLIEDFSTSLKLVNARCTSKSAIDASAFLSVRGICAFAITDEGASYELQFDVIFPATLMNATLITPVPIVLTALSKNLAGPMSLSQLQGEPKSGYLTMDHTRKLILVLESDPKVHGLPLVGIWVSGVEQVYSMYVWACCLRYLYNSHIEDRVCTPPEPFLLILYSPLHSRPHFYEVLPTLPARGPTFSLHTAVYRDSCPQSTDTGPVVLESCLAESGPKVDQFDVATYTLKKATTQHGTSLADDDSVPRKSLFNAEDIIPRVRAFPQPSQMPIKDSQVPEVSIFMQDAGNHNGKWAGPAAEFRTSSTPSKPHLASQGRSLSSTHASSIINLLQETTLPPTTPPTQTVVASQQTVPTSGQARLYMQSLGQGSHNTVHQQFTQNSVQPQQYAHNSVPQQYAHNSVPQQYAHNSVQPQQYTHNSVQPQQYPQNLVQSQQYAQNLMPPQQYALHSVQPQQFMHNSVQPQYAQNSVNYSQKSVRQQYTQLQQYTQPQQYQQQNTRITQPSGQRPMQSSNVLITSTRGSVPTSLETSSNGVGQYMQQGQGPNPHRFQNTRQPMAQLARVYSDSQLHLQKAMSHQQLAMMSQRQQSTTCQEKSEPQQQSEMSQQTTMSQQCAILQQQATMPQQQQQVAMPKQQGAFLQQCMTPQEQSALVLRTQATQKSQLRRLRQPQFIRQSETGQYTEAIPQMNNVPNTQCFQQPGHPQLQQVTNGGVRVDVNPAQDNMMHSSPNSHQVVSQRNDLPGYSHSNPQNLQNSIKRVPPMMPHNGTVGAGKINHSSPTLSNSCARNPEPNASNTSPSHSSNSQKDGCRLSHDSGFSTTPERPTHSPPGTSPSASPPRVASLADLRSDSVPPDVYQLLMQQDTQLKQLQAQLRQLLQQRGTTHAAAPTNSVAINTSFKENQGIAPSSAVESISIQTSPVKSHAPKCAPSSPHMWSPQSGTTFSTPSNICHIDAVCLNSTQNLEADIDIGNDLTQIMNNVRLHDETVNSEQSEIMLDMTSFSTSPTRTNDSHDTKSPVSASMVENIQSGGESLSDENTGGVSDKQFYHQIMTNIQTLLNKQKSSETNCGMQNQTASSSSQDPVSQNQVSQNQVSQNQVSQNQVSQNQVSTGCAENVNHDGSAQHPDVNDMGGSDADPILSLETSHVYSRYWPEHAIADTTIIPKINYVSMFLDSDTDTSLEMNALAMKYLDDEQLAQIAKLQAANNARVGNQKTNLLKHLLARESQATNITQYGMPCTDVSMATHKYMMRHGLIAGSNNLTLHGSRSRADNQSRRSELSQKKLELYSSYLDVIVDSSRENCVVQIAGTNQCNSTPSDNSLHSQMSVSSSHCNLSEHGNNSMCSSQSGRSNDSVGNDEGVMNQLPHIANGSPSYVSQSSDMVLDIARLRQLPKLL